MRGLVTSPNAYRCLEYLKLVEAAPEPAVAVAAGFIFAEGRRKKLDKALNHLLRTGWASYFYALEQKYWTTGSGYKDITEATCRAWFMARFLEGGGKYEHEELVFPKGQRFELRVKGDYAYFGDYKCSLANLERFLFSNALEKA